MFTGIIREVGTLSAKRRQGESYQLDIRAEKVLAKSGPGDSIAVNGVCLTVVKKSATGFTADVMSETLSKTNLGDLKAGSAVNLEPALGVGDLLDGHMVSGHIDGTGILKEVKQKSRSWIISISYPQQLDKYLITKGSVALNGISLTIVEVSGGNLKVSLIPETWRETTFSSLKIGDKINIEVDMLGKYVVKTTEKFLQGNQEQGPKDNSSGLTKEQLRSKGFL